MYFSYQNEGEPKISFIYSVYHEMICSLHVLNDETHHSPRQVWSQNMKAKMSLEDIENIKFYSTMTNDWLNLLEFINEEEYWNKSVTEILECLKKMDLKYFYSIILGEKYSSNIIERALLSLNIAPEIKKEHEDIFLQPKKRRIELIQFIKNYYYNYFASEISFIEPIYIRKLEHQYKNTKDSDTYEYINSLHPRIEVTKEKINLHKYKLFEFYKKDIDNILIFETSFIMPHLLIGWSENTISLTFPLYLTSYNENQVPKDRIDIFKAIADSTRLQIIKLLYDGPKSTQLLAEKLDLSEAAISKNLKLLYNAKVVSKERDGNYINYHLNVNVIDNLVYLLYEIISPKTI